MAAKGTKSLAGLAVAASLLSVSAPGLACGFHGQVGSNFSAQHPQSINVAVALRDAADAGIIDGRHLRPRQLKPGLADMLALNRAIRQLQRLRATLQQVADDASTPSFKLLLLESGMWNDFTFEAGALRFKAHTNGPSPGVPAIITGDSVLAAIAAGQLSPERALRSGLIVIDGPPELTRTLSAALLRFEVGAVPNLTVGSRSR